MKTFINYILEAQEVESWDNQKFTNGKNTYSVKDAIAIAKKHGELVNEFPIDKTDGLEWWSHHYSMKNEEHVKRMESSDTSFPILGIKQKDGTISVADGLNRVKKAYHIEKKTHIPAYVISMSTLKKHIG